MNGTSRRTGPRLSWSYPGPRSPSRYGWMKNYWTGSNGKAEVTKPKCKPSCAPIWKRIANTAKIILRDYVNATIGFQKLARVTGKKDTSLMRMLGPKGNPAARNLFELIALLQKHEGVRFQVTPQREALERRP